MTHYQTPDDLKFVAQLTSLAPVEAKAFLDFNHACERPDGAIPP